MNRFTVSKKEKIIVFGGSFNPLSKAHGDLIHLLINNYKPDRFILLPSSDEFIKEKKHFQEEDIIPLNKRLKILNEFNKRNRKIEIELIEINNPTFKTYDSLIFLKNPTYLLIVPSLSRKIAFCLFFKFFPCTCPALKSSHTA